MDEKAQPEDFQKALDHVWSWFVLHATQRLQAVNYFILATAFLSTGYVAALHYGFHGVAIGISILGLFVSYIFYRVERRIRFLIKSAEGALGPLQQRLAQLTSMPEIELCTRVEASTPGTWSYSKAFRYLYLGTGVVFGFGIANALYTLAMPQTSPPSFVGLFISLAAGTILLFVGVELLAQSPGSSLKNMAKNHSILVLGGVAVVAGIATLIYAVFVLVAAYVAVPVAP